VTIRWFTDSDRQDMRDAAEERRVLDELVQEYRPMRTMTAEERAERIANPRKMGTLRIDSHWRG